MLKMCSGLVLLIGGYKKEQCVCYHSGKSYNLPRDGANNVAELHSHVVQLIVIARCEVQLIAMLFDTKPKMVERQSCCP